MSNRQTSNETLLPAARCGVRQAVALFWERCRRTQGVMAALGIAETGRSRHPFPMVDKSPALESLTAQERIALMGRLWDSLDPAAAAPLSPALTAELERREAEADADPDAGIPWTALREELQARLR